MVNRPRGSLEEMLGLREAMHQLLADSILHPSTTLRTTGTGLVSSFPLNVYETAEVLKVVALLPGVNPDDVQVTIEPGRLTIAAHRQGWEPEGQEGLRWHVREIQAADFTRTLSIPFPVEVEQATADFAYGVLLLTLPKAAAAKPKRIQISSGPRHVPGMGSTEA